MAKNMSPAQIRKLLRDVNKTPAALAKDLEKSPTSFYLVIDGKSVSNDIRCHIAKAVNMPVEEIWPETYLVHGGPTRPGRPKTHGLYNDVAA